MKMRKTALCLALAATLGGAAAPVLAQTTKNIVTEAETASQVGFVDVYESKTRLVCAPTVLMNVDDESDLALAQSDTPPSTLILSVNDSLEVVDKEGNTLCSFDEAMNQIGKKCVVAVCVENETQSAALVEYCTANRTQDIFAIAKDAALLGKTVKGHAYLLGILDVRGQTLSYQETCGQASLASAKIVLADRDSYTYNDNRMLKALQVSVWTEANGEKEVFDAMYENYTGILTEDCASVYAAYEKIKARTLSDTSVFVGHRGSSGQYPENSVEAARYAVDQGVEAIEYDIHLTKDNKIVVMHDADISTTTNGSGLVAEMTLEEIQKYQLVGTGVQSVQIPTLADMLEEFKNDDVIHYIEYKVQNVAMVEYVKAEIEAAGMEGKVLFISYYADVLEKSKELMPNIPIGQLWGNFDTRDYDGALEKAVSTFYANGKTNHCAYTYLYKQYIEVARHRGITANGYTFVAEDSWQKYFYYDMGSLTIDRPALVGDMPVRVQASDFSVEVGESFTPNGEIVTATKSYGGNCSLVFLGDSEGAFIEENGAYVANEAGVYEVIFQYTHDDTYGVLSKTVEITVTEKEEEPDEETGATSDSTQTETSENETENGSASENESAGETEKKGGCGSVAASSGLVGVIGGLCAAFGLKKKRRKE